MAVSMTDQNHSGGYKAYSFLTNRVGWFRLWLAVSIPYWLFLTVLIYANWRPGKLSTIPAEESLEAALIFAAPVIVYFGAWIVLYTVRWIHAGFKGGE